MKFSGSYSEIEFSPLTRYKVTRQILQRFRPLSQRWLSLLRFDEADRDLEMIEMDASSIYISLLPSLSLDFRPRRISIWPDRTDILRSIFIFHPVSGSKISTFSIFLEK